MPLAGFAGCVQYLLKIKLTARFSRKSVSRSRPDLNDISPLSPDKPDDFNHSSDRIYPVKPHEPEYVTLQKGTEII